MSEIEENIAIIEIKKGDKIIKIKVDKKFYPQLKSKYIWKPGNYLKIRDKNYEPNEENLQRYIYFNLGQNEIVDNCTICYINGDKLDNTLENLRLKKINDGEITSSVLKKIEKGILIVNEKYQIKYKRQILGIFDTKEDAIEAYKNKVYDEEEEKKKKFLNQPIKRNDAGIAIIKLYSDGKFIGDVLLDDENYHDILSRNINYDGEYACFHNKLGKKKRLARYLLNDYKGKDIVDHIDRNKFNNQLSNLRILTKQQNNQNKNSKEGSSSKQSGVAFNKSSNKWEAYVYQGKKISLGFFKTEAEAAQARIDGAIKYYGGHANLDIDEDIAGQIAVLKLTEEEKKGESSKSAQKSKSYSKSKGKQKMEEPKQNAP